MQRHFATGSTEILVTAVTSQNHVGLVIAYHAHGTIVYHQPAFHKRLTQKTDNVGQGTDFRTVNLVLVVTGTKSFGHQAGHGQLRPGIPFKAYGIGVNLSVVNAAQRSKVGPGIIAATQQDAYPAAMADTPADGLRMQFSITAGVGFYIRIPFSRHLGFMLKNAVALQTINVICHLFI